MEDGKSDLEDSEKRDMIMGMRKVERCSLQQDRF